MQVFPGFIAVKQKPKCKSVEKFRQILKHRLLEFGKVDEQDLTVTTFATFCIPSLLVMKAWLLRPRQASDLTTSLSTKEGWDCVGGMKTLTPGFQSHRTQGHRCQDLEMTDKAPHCWAPEELHAHKRQRIPTIPSSTTAATVKDDKLFLKQNKRNKNLARLRFIVPRQNLDAVLRSTTTPDIIYYDYFSNKHSVWANFTRLQNWLIKRDSLIRLRVLCPITETERLNAFAPTSIQVMFIFIDTITT